MTFAFSVANAVFNIVAYYWVSWYRPSSDLILKLLTAANFYFLSYVRSTYSHAGHTILSGTSLVSKSSKFGTISEAKATCYQGRTNITFAFCTMGYMLMFHRMLLGDGYKSLIHCSLPIVSLLPMRANIQYENVFGFAIPNSTTHILHMMAVAIYVTGVTFFIQNTVLFWISLANILCLTIATMINFKHSLEVELFSFELFAIIWLIY